MSETVRAVVFDVGGVLEYTPPTGWQQRWAGRLGLDRAEFARRLGTTFTPGSTGAIDLPTAEREIAAALALDAAGLRAIMEDIWMCDTVVYSHEEGRAKPDPRFYAIVCERLGVTAAETMFLDDVTANIDAARAVGMTAVLFTDNRQAIPALQRVLGGGR